MAERPLHTPQGYGCKLDAALKIPELAADWTAQLPDLLVVDRGSIDFHVNKQMHPMPYDGDAFGSAEGYLTPEGAYSFLNDPKLPWETCLTMGDSWAFTNNSYDKKNVYKNSSNVVQSLVDVVAKGGNLLLDIGPDEHGLFPAPAVAAMEEVGAWLDVHGEAIYDTRPIWPHVFNLTRKTPSCTLNRSDTTGTAHCEVTQLRLTRKKESVYVAVILPYEELSTLVPLPPPDPHMGNRRRAQDPDGDSGGAEGGTAGDPALPASCAKLPLPLPLPFVVDGGIDGSWPDGELQLVELLGAPAALRLEFTLDSRGLAVAGLPQGCLPAAIKHVAVLKLSYTP